MKAVGADFNFLCGIFRSREKFLSSRQKLDSLLAAKSFSEAVTQAPEGLFGSQLKAHPGVDGIEAGCTAELQEITGLLASFSPRADFSRIVFLPWDFHNLKVAVLKKITGRGGALVAPGAAAARGAAAATGAAAARDELFGPEGEIGRAALSGMAEEMEFSALPRHMLSALEKAWIAYYESEKDSQSFELALDRQKQIALGALAASVSPGIREHIETVSDLSVADVFFRAFFARLPWKRAAWGVQEHPDAGVLGQMYAMKLEDWGGRLSSISRKPLHKLILSARSAQGAAAAVAQARREHLAAMNDWRYKPPSVEFAYYFISRKLADIYNLRLVYLCSLNRIPEAEIRGRVNDAFL